MVLPHLVDRFDIFEQTPGQKAKYLTWRGAFKTLEEAQNKLETLATESRNEFYVKDIHLGVVVARANTFNTSQA